MLAREYLIVYECCFEGCDIFRISNNAQTNRGIARESAALGPFHG